MKKTEQYCNENDEYSLTECISRFIHNKVGCNVFDSKTSRACTSRKQLLELRDLLLWIKRISAEELQKETGCLYKCAQTLVYNLRFE